MSIFLVEEMEDQVVGLRKAGVVKGEPALGDRLFDGCSALKCVFGEAKWKQIWEGTGYNFRVVCKVVG